MNWLTKKHKEVDIDWLIINRDGLLKKKRLIDAIDRLRSQAKEGQKEFQTNLNYLITSTGISEWNPLTDLMQSVENQGIVSFKIDEDPTSIEGWGYYSLFITIGEKFDEFARGIREKYHAINKKLIRSKDLKGDKWIYYTSLFWLISKTVRFFWKHKIGSIIFTLLSLLAIDYSLTWRNLNLLKNFITTLFK